MRLYLLALFCMAGSLRQASAQVRQADSLRRTIDHAKDPHQKLSSLLALCAIRKSLPVDTLSKYVDMTRALSRSAGSVTQQRWADFYFAQLLMIKGLTDSSIAVITGYVSKLSNIPSERTLLVRSEFLRTNGFMRKNRFREALKGYYSILNTAEEQNDTLSLAMARNGLGWVHMEMGQYQKAVIWLRSALSSKRDSLFFMKYNFVYANLASTYNSLSVFDSAEYFATRSIEGARKFDDQEGQANGLNILADTYINTNRSTEAGSLLQQVMGIRENIGDPYYIVSDMMQLAKFYAHHNEPAKGIALSLKGIDMAKKMELSSKLPILYDALAQNYEAKGDYKHCALALKELLAVKDSVYKINSIDVEGELKIRYELQRNENTIIRQKLDLVEKNYWLNAYILFFSLTLLTGLFVFREYRKKSRMRMRTLMESEKEATFKAIVEAEENQRKRISSDLHDSLGGQANALLYGIELLQQDQRSNPSLVNNLHHTAKDMLVTLRETLWAMKVKEATAAEVWLRVINFSKQLGRYYPSVAISTVGVVPAGFHISAAKSLSIVLILQESLNNSVRHSAARNINVTSRDDGDVWTITLQDDGKGFDPGAAAQKKESYGLSNMKSRAQFANIRLTIIAAENEGTTIELGISHPQ